jgi:hypothetical protein
MAVLGPAIVEDFDIAEVWGPCRSLLDVGVRDGPRHPRLFDEVELTVGDVRHPLGE